MKDSFLLAFSSSNSPRTAESVRHSRVNSRDTTPIIQLGGGVDRRQIGRSPERREILSSPSHGLRVGFAILVIALAWWGRDGVRYSGVYRTGCALPSFAWQESASCPPTRSRFPSEGIEAAVERTYSTRSAILTEAKTK